MADRSAGAEQVVAALRACSDPEKAAFLPRFFRTGPGEYGAGDRFLGVTVPLQRRVARSFRDLEQPGWSSSWPVRSTKRASPRY